MASSKKILEAKNICKLHNNIPIINNISLTAYEHEVTTIIGPSGTGKSTFLRCLNLLNYPNSGELYLNNKKILLEAKHNELHPKNSKELLDLRQKVGFVFQNFNLWQHLTVLQNIIEAPTHVLKQKKDEAIHNAELLLDKVGLLNKRDAYPISLSGGEQQRIAIARTLAMKPLVMLLDEPTSALDPEKTREVTDVLNTLAKEGTTMIIVTHEMGFCKAISNKVIFLNNGKVEEEGNPSDVFDNPKSLRLQQFLNSVL
ncbi:ATP-binding cassette domain-containing protein [Rickettsiales bacterium LUAb2]